MDDQYVCSACGAIRKEDVFLVSRVVMENDRYVRKQDVPWTAERQYTQICKHARREGCINTCKSEDPKFSFEARSKGVTTEKWLDVAKSM